MAQNERQLFQDVPAVESGLTSSIGALWPPDRASFNRIKGIYTPAIVDCSEHLERLLVEFARESSRVETGDIIDRVSFRVVFSCDMLRSVGPNIAQCVEAIIPLSGTQPAFEETILVYLGKNGLKRQSKSEEVKRYSETVRHIKRDAPIPRTILERAGLTGYQLQMLPELICLKAPARENIILQMSALYERFGWTRREVEEILFKPNSIIGVAIKDGQIVSAGIAEMASVPIGKHVLRFVEITEAATADGHTGQGLYTAVSTSLLLEIARRSKNRNILDGEVDLVYGECNGNAPGVLKTSAHQGRTFSYDMGARFGFPGSGILPQHVPISGAPRETPYNDLFPTFLNRETIYANYTR